MITLYKARLKALAEDPATRKHLESKYDWRPRPGRIVQGAESAFLIIDTWEPEKGPKSAYRYYLVKE